MPITELYDKDSNVPEQSDKTVLIEFYTEWCPTCRAMKQTLEKFSDTKSDIEVYTVNVDENPSLTRRYGVMSVPTFVAVHDSRIVSRASGAVNRRELEDMVTLKEAVR